MSSSKIMDNLALSPEMMEELDKIEDASFFRTVTWTKEMDACILYGWPKKNKVEFAKWFKAKYKFGSDKSIRRRYHFLIQNEKSPDEYGNMFPE